MKKELVLVGIVSLAVMSFGAQAAEESMKGPPVGGTFKRLDANGDGKIDRGEAQADPDLVGHFNEYDLNHDNVITPDEVQKYDEAAKGRGSKSAPSSSTPSDSGMEKKQ